MDSLIYRMDLTRESEVCIVRVCIVWYKSVGYWSRDTMDIRICHLRILVSDNYRDLDDDGAVVQNRAEWLRVVQ